MVYAETDTLEGARATVCTASTEWLSTTGNCEVNLEFVDHDQVAAMEQNFRTDVSNCEELTLEARQQRKWQRRVAELVLTPLRPFL